MTAPFNSTPASRTVAKGTGSRYGFRIRIFTGFLYTRVRPDTGPHITRSGSEIPDTVGTSNWAGRHGNDGVLMSLEHELCVAGTGIPELDTAILRTGEDPLRVGGQCNAKDKVL